VAAAATFARRNLAAAAYETLSAGHLVFIESYTFKTLFSVFLLLPVP